MSSSLLNAACGQRYDVYKAGISKTLRQTQSRQTHKTMTHLFKGRQTEGAAQGVAKQPPPQRQYSQVALPQVQKQHRQPATDKPSICQIRAKVSLRGSDLLYIHSPAGSFLEQEDKQITDKRYSKHTTTVSRKCRKKRKKNLLINDKNIKRNQL